MCTCPVVIMVSTATRLRGSSASIASRIESLIWSAILSGWPSVTDSDVKRRRDTRYSLGTTADGPARWMDRLRTLPAGGDRACTANGGSAVRRRCGGGRRGGENARRDGVLAAAGHLGRGAVGAQDDDGVVGAAEDLTGRHVVDHQHVAALAGQLRAGV